MYLEHGVERERKRRFGSNCKEKDVPDAGKKDYLLYV